MLEKFERREIDPDEWRAFRLVRGTYGQRYDGDVHMLRLKVPRVLDARPALREPKSRRLRPRALPHRNGIDKRKGFMADFVKVATTNEIEPGQARLVNVQGKSIALFNVEGQFFALDNTCTHRGGPLAEGEISGHEVTCPLHGATFDIPNRRGPRSAGATSRRALRRPRDGNRHRGRGVGTTGDRAQKGKELKRCRRPTRAPASGACAIRC